MPPEAGAYWWQPEVHRSVWMVVGLGNQVSWRSIFFYSLLLVELLSVRNNYLPVRERFRNIN
jgi:hypothetical protein